VKVNAATARSLGRCFGSSGTAVIAAFDNWIRQLAVGKDPTDQGLMPTIERLLHGWAARASLMHALSGSTSRSGHPRAKLEGDRCRSSSAAEAQAVETYASLLQ